MSKFNTGNKAGRGRPPGSPNKVTATAKEFLQMLSDELRDTILNDLSQLEPLDRVKVFIQLQEFLLPKLARVQNIDQTLEKEPLEIKIIYPEDIKNILPHKPM
jgi:hypothetical protein